MALLSALFFGMSTPLSKMMLSQLPPFKLAGLLYLGGAIGVLPFVIRGLFVGGKRPESSGQGKNNSLYIVGAVLFGGILGPVFLLIGLKHAMSSSVSLWLNLELVFTAILGHFFFKDYLSRIAWVSVVGIIIGSILISMGEGASGPVSALFVALACFCWGLDNNYTSLIDNLSPSQSTLIKGIFAGSINLGIGCFLTGGWGIPVSVFFIAVLTGCFAYGLSISLYIASAQHIGAVRGQVIFSTSPFLALIMSVFLLKEALSFYHYAAMIIYIGAIVLLMVEKHNHEHTHSIMEHIHSHRHDDGHHDHVHESLSGNIVHSHLHIHQEKNHSHFHLPDLHHRHSH